MPDPRDPVTPPAPIARRGYALCGEPRSGSTYLARLLGSTGVMGHPFEFFRNAAVAARAERDPAGALLDSVRRASSANGVYGLKIFARQFDLAQRTRWAERLPGLRFVHLERRDLLGQAISQVRALQTGQYESGHSIRAAPRYDRRRIAAALARTAHNQARWRIWFARNGLDPLRLGYEELVADPQAAVDAVARALALDCRPRIDPSRITLSKQADALSEAWRNRFLAEAGDIGRLDAPFWRIEVTLRRLRAAVRQTTSFPRRRE